MTDTTLDGVAATAAPASQPAAVEQEVPQSADTQQAEAPETEHTEDAAASEHESGDDATDESRPRKSKGGFQKRIDQLTRERIEAELRNQHLQREVEALRKQAGGDALDAEPGEEPKLDGGQYATVEEWQQAHALWAKRQGYQHARQEVQAREQRERAMTAQASLNARVEQAKAKYPDFNAVVGPVAQIIDASPVLNQYALESEMAADVAYHLAKNPAILVELTKLSPVSAMRELTRLEARLSAPPPPKKLTNAPDPITPVGARETAPTTLGDLAGKEDVSAYIARRNKAGR